MVFARNWQVLQNQQAKTAIFNFWTSSFSWRLSLFAAEGVRPLQSELWGLP